MITRPVPPCPPAATPGCPSSSTLPSSASGSVPRSRVPWRGPGRASSRWLPALAAAFALGAAQAGTLEDIRERGVIRLGYSETKAPFSFKARDDHQPAGYSVELCKRVALSVLRTLDLSSLKIEWVALDPSTRLEAVLMRRVDIECGTTTATLSRRREVDFSLPIFADVSTLVSRTQVARSLPELDGRRIAVAEATTTEQALVRALEARRLKAEVVRTRTVAEAFELLKSGRVEAVAGDRTALVGIALLEGQGDQALTLMGEVLSYEPYALALRRGDAAFRLLVDTALSELYRSGEIEKIVDAWLAPIGPLSPAVRVMFQLNALPQ